MSDGQRKGKVSGAMGIIPIIAVVYLIHIYALYLVPGYSDRFPIEPQMFVNIGTALLVILCAIMFTPFITSMRYEGEEVIEVEPEYVVKEAPKPETITYPKKIPGYLYARTTIQISPYKKLIYRTVVGRSCLLCEKRKECYGKYRDRIPYAKFIKNVECEEGLRKIAAGG